MTPAVTPAGGGPAGGLVRPAVEAAVPVHRPAEPSLPDLLARASHALVQGFAEELRGRGTGLPVWRVMAALSDHPSQTVGDLAEACLLQQPTTTKLLDRMARDGLVARAQDARDHRLVRVTLTREGEARAAGLAEAAERCDAEVLARHPEAEGIKAMLRAIIARSGPAPHIRDGDSEPGRPKGLEQADLARVGSG